jgi:GMP synthase-like glutamine amidotransferase
MRTLIIDNYLPNSPQIEHLYNVVKDITVHTVEVKSYLALTDAEGLKLYDIIILSGSQRKLADPEVLNNYTNEAGILKSINKPVLGICFGHQLIGIAFGENIVTMDKIIDGYYMVRRISDDKIFDGLGERFLVRESHEEQIENTPFDFLLLADSPNCPIEVMKHSILPIYGLQFHPERFDDKHPSGHAILENFFRLAVL